MFIFQAPSRDSSPAYITPKDYAPNAIGSLQKQWDAAPFLVKELAGLSTLGVVMTKLTTFFFSSLPAAIPIIVLAPFLEEITFRGLVQDVVKDIQKLLNRCKVKTSKQLTDQKIFRVAIVGIMFGAAHLTNPYSLAQRILQAVHTTFLGFNTALMKEETGSLIPCVIAHAINNTIAVVMYVGAVSLTVGYTCFAIYRVALMVISCAGLENTKHTLSDWMFNTSLLK